MMFEIERLAVASRVVAFIMQVIFNAMIPDHDANVFETIKPSEPKSGDKLASFLFSGYSRWDAQYFLHISQHGYTHENCLAFFPLFPSVVSFTARLFHPLLNPIFSPYYLSLFSGSIVNFAIFVVSCRFLYKLTLFMFQDVILANLAVLFFCINPASIFFSACYSEAMFSCFTFASIFFLEKRNNWIGAAFVGLCILSRSNGIVLIPLIMYLDAKYFLCKINIIPGFQKRLKFIIYCFISLVISLVLAILPYLLYQYYVYNLYCYSSNEKGISEDIVRFAKAQGYKLRIDAEPPPWCFYRIPNFYSYIQAKYWNVGVFKYYEFKQIPNFILAFPVIFIATYEIFNYFKSNLDVLKCLGLSNTISQKGSALLFVYVLHLTGLLVTCILVVHIQVTTRLLFSASPVIYWFIAIHVRQDIKNLKLNFQNSKDFMICFQFLISKSKVKYIIRYFCLYFTLGIFIHVNFLPWT